jgi:hypothetical protein
MVSSFFRCVIIFLHTLNYSKQMVTSSSLQLLKRITFVLITIIVYLVESLEVPLDPESDAG